MRPVYWAKFWISHFKRLNTADLHRGNISCYRDEGELIQRQVRKPNLV